MKSLADLCRENGWPQWQARRVYDYLFKDGPRAGLYRLVREEDIATLSHAMKLALKKREAAIVA